MGAGGGHSWHYEGLMPLPLDRRRCVSISVLQSNLLAVEANAFEKDTEGSSINCNPANGDLVNEGLQDRVGKPFRHFATRRGSGAATVR